MKSSRRLQVCEAARCQIISSRKWLTVASKNAKVRLGQYMYFSQILKVLKPESHPRASF